MSDRNNMMPSSAIGRSLATRPRITAAAVTGLAALALDMTLSAHYADLWVRALPALAAIGVLYGLAGGDRGTFGFQLRPTQGWGFWAVASALAAGCILLLCVGYCVLLPSAWADNVSMGRYIRYTGIWPRVVFGCIQVPLLEESVYRVILCVALLGVAGRLPTILLSGVLFSILHVIYGNPGPDNFVAGFLLGWAYLKSESILVPIAMHAGGNAGAILFQLASASWSH